MSARKLGDKEYRDYPAGFGTAQGVAPRTPEQQFAEWFGQSRAIRPDGTPAILYRGEHGARIDSEHLQSRLNSLSFTEDRDAANTYAMSPNNKQYDNVAKAPRITPVHLKIENPIIENCNDPFIDLSHLADRLGQREAMRIALKFDHDIRYTCNWEEHYAHEYCSVVQLLTEKPDELKNLYFDAHKFLDDPIEVERLKGAGYDGAIHIGNGETATSLEYRVFDSRRVRSALSGGCPFWRDGRADFAVGNKYDADPRSS